MRIILALLYVQKNKMASNHFCVKSVGCTFNQVKQCHLKSSVAAVKEKTGPDFSLRGLEK